VLASFEQAMSMKQLDDAFVYGMRYCTFCVEGLVQHDYYNSPKFSARRAATNRQVSQVLGKLEQVADWMDLEEVERETQRQLAFEKIRQERIQKQKQQEAMRLQEIERKIEQYKHSYLATNNKNNNNNNAAQEETPFLSPESVQESAFAKLQRLNMPTTPTSSLPNGKPEPDGFSFARSGSTDSGEHLPPPVLPPNSSFQQNGNGGAVVAPPPYDQAAQFRSNSYFGPGNTNEQQESKRSVSFAPMKPPSLSSSPKLPSYDQVAHKQQPPPPLQQSKKRPANITKRVEQVSRDYTNAQRGGKIQISALGTHQGRERGSTNGCTVISALTAAQHLKSHGGVTTPEINSIIDSHCVPVLRDIRNKLSLHGDSLIIPSDVHDHLVDQNILFQHKFVGAAGGNILQDEHIGQVLELLQGTTDKSSTRSRKAAATLFFREHVISIVKFPTSPTTAVYDLIDSLPSFSGKGTRTRCQDLQSLSVLLNWYACHKFSDSNLKYISSNEWDDGMADFDPRVFQAFVWADLPKPKQ
jgi:hypothetical protein